MTTSPASLTPPDVLDRELGALAAFGLSGAVMVVDHERGEHYAGAWGLADRASGTPFALDTISDIGSTSKQFTAAAILTLADRGALDVHDPIEAYVPDVPEDKRAITLHHLLNHTAGLAHEHFETDFDEFEPEEAEQRILAIATFAGVGEQFRYSNAGYTLLARIVERVSGQSFREYVRERLLAPAGMESTGWYEEPSLRGRVVAHGYTGNFDHGSAIDFRGPTWAILGTGGMISTAGDLQRWATALRTPGAVLSEEALRRMRTPGLNDYGYGVKAKRDAKGRFVIVHGGASFYGHSATLRRFEELGVTLTALFNTMYQGMFMVSVIEGLLVDVILDGVSPSRGVVMRVPERFPVASGTYRAESGETIELWTEGPSPVIGAASPQATDLLAGTDVAARIAQLEEPSLAVVRGLAAGDREAVARQFAPGVAREELLDSLRFLWGYLVAEQGVDGEPRYLGGEPPRILFEIIATGPLPPAEQLLTTYVRITDVTALRLVWGPHGLVGAEDPIGTPGRPVKMHVAEAEDGRFLAMDLRTLRQVELAPAGDGVEVVADERSIHASGV